MQTQLKPPARTVRQPSILAVDDERANLQILASMCDAHGYLVRSVSSGESAILAAEDDPPDLILLDIEMPDMDGYAVCRYLKRDRELRDIPVIFISASSENLDKIKAFSSGAVDYVTKPIQMEELHARIKTHLRIRDLQLRLEHAIERLADTNVRMHRDLQAAAKIQQTFLPQHVPEVPGLKFSWMFRPCDELAGDGLNIIPLGNGQVALYVLDVCGHGVASALLAVTLTRFLSSRLEASIFMQGRSEQDQIESRSPAVVADQLNKLFPVDPATFQFSTLLYGILNVESGEFRYISAGHPGPIRLSGDANSEILMAEGFPIGLAEDSYEERSVRLSPGDRLYLYTDGISETISPASELFGMTRFTETLKEFRTEPLNAGINAVLEKITQWQGSNPFRDDISILGVEVL